MIRLFMLLALVCFNFTNALAIEDEQGLLGDPFAYLGCSTSEDGDGCDLGRGKSGVCCSHRCVLPILRTCYDLCGSKLPDGTGCASAGYPGVCRGGTCVATDYLDATM